MNPAGTCCATCRDSGLSEELESLTYLPRWYVILFLILLSLVAYSVFSCLWGSRCRHAASFLKLQTQPSCSLCFLPSLSRKAEKSKPRDAECTNQTNTIFHHLWQSLLTFLATSESLLLVLSCDPLSCKDTADIKVASREWLLGRRTTTSPPTVSSAVKWQSNSLRSVENCRTLHMSPRNSPVLVKKFQLPSPYLQQDHGLGEFAQ